jgi:hypothetical protein
LAKEIHRLKAFYAWCNIAGQYTKKIYAYNFTFAPDPFLSGGALQRCGMAVEAVIEDGCLILSIGMPCDGLCRGGGGRKCMTKTTTDDITGTSPNVWRKVMGTITGVSYGLRTLVRWRPSSFLEE